MMKRKTKQGFTLIELLLVIAIIGILAAIIMINLSAQKERAQWTAYQSYVFSVSRFVQGTIASGGLESIITNRTEYLGDCRQALTKN